jgi:4-hydroxy-2-oxoheptanedioate aldolase
MHENPIKAALKRGETVCAMWVSTGSPDVVEAAVRLGWKAIIVDNEHGVADLDGAVALHRAALAAGGDIILRIPSYDPTMLKLVLDRGIRSIMCPMVNSAEEAEAFVAACRYPPRGRRGYAAPIVRGSGWGTVPNYKDTAHEELLLIAQIEHREAVPNIAAMAAVDGIDALLLGPNDLAGTYGKLEKLDDPEMLALYEEVEKAVVASGKWFGSIVRPGRTPRELHEVGCRIIAGPSDIGLFLGAAREALAEFTFDDPAPAPAKTKGGKGKSRAKAY